MILSNFHLKRETKNCRMSDTASCWPLFITSTVGSQLVIQIERVTMMRTLQFYIEFLLNNCRKGATLWTRRSRRRQVGGRKPRRLLLLLLMVHRDAKRAAIASHVGRRSVHRMRIGCGRRGRRSRSVRERKESGSRCGRHGRHGRRRWRQ